MEGKTMSACHTKTIRRYILLGCALVMVTIVSIAVARPPVQVPPPHAGPPIHVGPPPHERMGLERGHEHGIRGIERGKLRLLETPASPIGKHHGVQGMEGAIERGMKPTRPAR